MDEKAYYVEKREDYGQGYTDTQFGFRIGQRIWWVGIEDSNTYRSGQSEKDRELCNKIIKRYNSGID